MSNPKSKIQNRKSKMMGWAVTISLFPALGCLIGSPAATAIPAGRPADFEVQTATPTLDPQITTRTPGAAEPEAAVVLPLGDAPTHTPDPSIPTATLIPPATLTSTLEAGPATPELTSLLPLTATAAITPVTELTRTTIVTTPTAPPPAASQPAAEVVEPDPPLQGGDWDFEQEFVPWGNPYGEPCPGGAVASGWTAFVQEGEFGSSCFNENLYKPNVFSGLKSQEITFDFISASSGIYRTIPTRPGHSYKIVAYAKHDRSIAPVEMFLGVDLSGGTAWDAPTVEWFPWDDGAEDTWVATEETATATGEQMTLFIRGFHPLAEQGGKTVIDNVSVTDLGLE